LKVLIISAAIFISDQLSKILLKGISIPQLDINIIGISSGEKHSLIGEYINLTLLENPGFAFGIDPGIELKPVLTILTLIITAGLFINLYLSRNGIFIKKLALAFLIGGAAGNLTDRIFYGRLYDYAPLFYGNVVDFINIKISGSLLGQMVGNYVFNIADLAVFAGLVLLIVSLQTLTQTEKEILAAENQD
jgi:signal peptidase II